MNWQSQSNGASLLIGSGFFVVEKYVVCLPLGGQYQELYR